ncbi:hypothetical protein [Portibacter lacus]|uniref:Lipoprotein n=1 Tax=Portibacter lacus TaxID=1099794 RepID=A0AA37WH60_9BACT|nr:hypothetical protein [Portibacter lacus]GLR18959.1 hypothetical protein GCM10007940_35750 [Portibacter lacus]
MKIKILLYFIICLPIFLTSCITYDAETEKKFQENKAFMSSYLEELGYKDSPFLTRLPSDESDKQKKKMIAVMSKEEIKTFIDQQTSGVPKFNTEHSRTQEFLREVEGLKPKKAYEVLIEKYPEIILN